MKKMLEVNNLKSDNFEQREVIKESEKYQKHQQIVKFLLVTPFNVYWRRLAHTLFK